MPDRINSLLLVSSLAPFDDDRAFNGMLTTNWLLFQCARYTPVLLTIPISVMGAIASWNAEWRLNGLAGQLCDADQRILRMDDLRRVMLADMTESIRNGVGAAEHEVRLLSRDWGFDLNAIRTPVTIVHGDSDLIAPLTMATILTERLPNSRLIIRREEGHFLLFRHWRAIIRMAQSPAPAARLCA
jgi:pimeloyl-ACP methyl ester carboxylesterase